MSASMSRRALLRATAGGAVLATTGATAAPAAAAPVPVALRELEAKIRSGMAKYRIPGVAVGVLYPGGRYVRGFGVTDVDNPVPVDGDTVFRVASTTKTFTGTTIMRLVERGRIDLDRTVRSYLPDFRTADAAASARVTVRELLNHSAGWLGDFFLDTGSDAGTLARYATAMAAVPQLTAPGTVFAYNNAALSLAGRLIEVATGSTYERAVRTLVLDPLRLRHSAFTLAAIPGAALAVPHDVTADGVPVSQPGWFPLWRSINPAGGLISSARDQLRWARFHLGTGLPLLTPRSLHAMRSHPGPGGTLLVELDGMGVTWMLRPTAEGPTVVQHGGDLPGQHSGFLLVPERGFALTVLTNSQTGPLLIAELCSDDWALRRFAGLRNLPAAPRTLPADRLAGYAGSYAADTTQPDGSTVTTAFDLVPDAGQLSLRVDGREGGRLVFYRDDYVLIRYADGTDSHSRADFIHGTDGSVTWLRYGGRLYRRGTTEALRPAAQRTPQPATLPYPTPSG